MSIPIYNNKSVHLSCTAFRKRSLLSNGVPTRGAQLNPLCFMFWTSTMGVSLTDWNGYILQKNNLLSQVQSTWALSLTSCDCPWDVYVSARAPFPCWSGESDPGSASSLSQSSRDSDTKMYCTVSLFQQPGQEHRSKEKCSTESKQADMVLENFRCKVSDKSWSYGRAVMTLHQHSIWKCDIQTQLHRKRSEV